MQTETPKTIFLKDYEPTPQAIRHVRLLVDLHPTATRIVSDMQVEPRKSAPMVLHGARISQSTHLNSFATISAG